MAQVTAVIAENLSRLIILWIDEIGELIHPSAR